MMVIEKISRRIAMDATRYIGWSVTQLPAVHRRGDLLRDATRFIGWSVTQPPSADFSRPGLRRINAKGTFGVSARPGGDTPRVSTGDPSHRERAEARGILVAQSITKIRRSAPRSSTTR